MKTEHFLLTAMDRFGLNNWFRTESKEENLVIVAEEFFTFLIAMITDRTSIGASGQQLVRRWIIHRLCVQDFSHSQLVETVPKEFTKHPQFDEILDQVATKLSK